MATTAEVQIAYDSPDPNVHAMDVEQLGPSLVAIGNLCKRANALLNGDRASVKVLVQSDFEHKCFLINFQVVQDIYSQVHALLQNHDVKTSKEILEWLGLVEASLGGFGLFSFLKAKRGRKPQSIKISDKDGTVELTFKGDKNTVTVNQNVFQLSMDQSVIASVKGILAPTLSPDVSAVEFRDHGRLVEKVHKDEALEIIQKEFVDPPPDPNQLTPQVIDARLAIYSPVFDQDAKIWRFVHGDRIIKVNVTDSGIPEDVLRRGTVSIGDSYLVSLEITEHKTEKGYRNTYRVLGYTQFLPAQPGAKQYLLELKPDDDAE